MDIKLLVFELHHKSL